MLSPQKRMSDCRLSVVDPGEGPGPPTPLPLFLDQTEACRAENVFFFSESGPPHYLKVWIWHWLWYYKHKILFDKI